MNRNPITFMRVFISVVCLVFCLGSITRAANPIVTGDSTIGAARKDAEGGKSGEEFVVGVSPFLDKTVKDPVYQGLVRLIVEGLPLGAKLEVYDAYNLKSITRLSIPNANVFNSPKTRANQFAGPIGEIKAFLASEHKPSGPKPAFEGAIRLPQFCNFLSQERTAREESVKLPLLLIGSPLYQDSQEPVFSMVDGYFPSDGHLRVSREESVFGFNSGDASAQRLLVYWVYFGDPWLSDLHREKVSRFWSLYIEGRGGQMGSFSPDLATAMRAFGSEAPGTPAAANGWVVDPLQKTPEMVRATRNVQLVDWLTGDVVPETRPPSRFVGPLKIGIRWKDNIDLDLYATPRPDAETLFFEHPRSPEGYYFKDHRSSPGREYEYIEFESPVDVREVKGFVNFYAGSCPDGPRGEVRIEFLNRIYSGNFAIASPEGNQGRSGRSQAAFWTEIPIQEILRINERLSQRAGGSN